ncbi:MAG: hypothetical protein A2184_00210 [Candidatus Moranbacteria bacterium RIFOXYA1_FULL_44_7]|nr:MAG: hypothetical protein A2184_00210 [Candidatus Moranbacteria bacterium RIFOXYA1_FULL_44_7]
MLGYCKFRKEEDWAMTQKRYTEKNDFVAIMGRNTDGKIQARLWKRIFPMVEKVKFFVNQILAQMIHDRVIWDPNNSREESDWFAAEKLLLRTYNSEGFLDITIGCFLLEAARVLQIWDPKSYNLDQVIVKKSESFFIVGKKFFLYLNEMAVSGKGIWHIFQTAAADVEINFESVERSMWVELDELFRDLENEGYHWFSG